MYRVQNGSEESRRIYSGLGGFVARAVDSVLAPLAPRLVLERQKARAGSAALLNYNAAKSMRTRRAQRASSADQDLLNDLPKLRTNSRAMVRDDSSAAALVRVLEDNVVGTGMRPQMMVSREATGMTDKEADAWNSSCEQFFAAAADDLDASENDSFWGMQRLALRSLVVDGECLLHRTYIDEPGRRTIGTAFEMIDVDRLVDPIEASTMDIRSGVEVGDRQNALAYWITPRHPDEWGTQWRTDRLKQNKAERWARYAGGQASILHLFRRDRSGQTRGVPFFAPCFGLVEAMNDMLETELQAARAAAKFCAFIKQTMDSNTISGLEQDKDGQWHERLESGTIRYLNEGEELVPYTPNRPGNNFEPFVVRVLRSITAALGLPYELVLKDFSKMNYSSARVALLEARRGFEVLQQLLVEKLCQPVFRAVILDGVINGKLKMPRGFMQRPSLFLRAYWQPPAWGWVDPVKEIESSRMAIENSLSTPQAEAARQGGDAESNLELRARFLKKAYETEKAYGLDKGELTRERSERIETVQNKGTNGAGDAQADSNQDAAAAADENP